MKFDYELGTLTITDYLSDSALSLLGRILQHDRFSIDRAQLLHDSNWHAKFGRESLYRPLQFDDLSRVPSELYDKNRELIDPQPFVSEISNVDLFTSFAIAADIKHRYIIEESEGSSSQLANSLLKSIFRTELPINFGRFEDIEGPIASFIGLWSSGFYHWFADYLPRLRGIEEYEKARGEHPKILIAEDRPRWIDESLTLMDLNSEYLVEYGGDRLRIDTFVIPSLPRFVESDGPPWGYSPSPQALKWVRGRIRSNVGVTPGNEYRLLITRRSADRRRLQNESDVIQLAESYGFTPVDLTEFTLAEQVELFAKAEAVLAPHGAGLINMIYADDLQVFELFGDYVNACYYTLSGGFDFSYQFAVYDQVHGDILVDIPELEHMLRDWIEM